VSARYVSVSWVGGAPAPPPALEEVSLTVRTGEILALLGPNGAGKSTVLRVVAGLLPVSSGEALALGASIALQVRRDRRAFARVVAYVGQSEGAAAGFGAFRVREIVAMGRAPHQGAWMSERADDAVAVDDAMKLCDLAALAERRAESLSGGEVRRVAIARALAQRPRILLLDEPAAFLDVRHRLELHDLLADVVAKTPMACIVTMHELAAAAKIAAQVALLKGGRLIASGAPDDVLTPEHLRAAFDASVHRGRDAATGEPYFVATRAS
jgi:iron complex transport system ATP-binding protein